MEVEQVTRTTIPLSGHVKELLARLVPDAQRPAFVERAVLEALKRMEQEQLERDMEECARVMYDEIMAIQRDMTPLEEELHRKT